MAQRHWVGGNGNWSDAGLVHWSLTNGGAAGVAVPTALDDVFFDSGSGSSSVTLDAATAKLALTLTVNGFTGTLTFNVNLSVSGSITFTTTGFSFSAGGGTLRMIAAGTWTTNGKTVAVPVEIGGTTTFTCTLADALTISQGLTLSNTTSTIFSGAFNITCSAGSIIQGSQTITLTGHLIFTGAALQFSDANVINTSTGKELQVVSLTLIGASTGTALVRFTGGGTLAAAAAISNSISVDGDTTMSGTCLFAASGTPTLTLNGGGLTGSGTLSIASACTIVGHATKGISNIILTAAITLTINTNVLLVSGTFTWPNAAVTLGGTAGLNAETWANTTIATAARTYTFTQTNTYTCGTANNLTGATATLTITLVSSDGTNKVPLTLGYDATQDSIFVNFTRIDGSAGQCWFSARATITTSFNVANSTASSNILNEGGGEALTISGVTYNSLGAILGSCNVYLMRDNGDSTATFIAATISNASTGVYSFTCFPGSTYFTVAWKEGSPDVFDVTDRELVAA